MDLAQKYFIIWLQAEIILKILDVALLQGPQPIKIGVVEFCTVPLVATSQKTPIMPLLATQKMENAFLY
jgi:hypothetical protein